MGEKTPLEIVREIANEAVLSGQPYPQSLAKEALIGAGVRSPYVEFALTVGQVEYEDDIGVIRGIQK